MRQKSKVKQIVELRTQVVLGIALLSTYMATIAFAAAPFSKMSQGDDYEITKVKITKKAASNTKDSNYGDWGYDRVDTLSVCDFNNDGARNLSDIGLFVECQDTFDANNDGVHNLNDLALYAQNNQNDVWCMEAMSECYVKDPNVLSVCDFNNDGARNLSDLSLFAKCQDTFDANNDGVHNLNDLALYAQNNQNDVWCMEAMSECYVQKSLSVCDFNNDGARDLVDLSLFANCLDTFDANGDDTHDLVDVSLYAQYNGDQEWCMTNMVECFVPEQQ